MIHQNEEGNADLFPFAFLYHTHWAKGVLLAEGQRWNATVKEATFLPIDQLSSTLFCRL